MQLLSDRILVEPVAKEANTTESGIFMGGKPKNDNEYTVVLIGTQVKYTRVGDVVRKKKYVTATPLQYNGRICYLLREDTELDFNM